MSKCAQICGAGKRIRGGEANIEIISLRSKYA